jgi:hypothetical protein
MTGRAERHPTTQAARTSTSLGATPRPGRTPQQIEAEQRAGAERECQRKADLQARHLPPGTAIVPAQPAALPAVPDTRSSVQQYIDEIAPASMVGRRIKFTKDGTFITPDDEATIDDDVDFVALCDQTLAGRIKFNGEGAAPDFKMGLIYDDFVPPQDEDLPDRDQAQWEIGLDGKPSDPWQHQIYLVLQRGDTGELFTFTTSSKTGRRAVGNLLRHYDRMQKTHPDMYPVVRLKVGGFNHPDTRVGWVATPVFPPVGRHPKDDAAKPDSSPAADMNDSLPFN